MVCSQSERLFLGLRPNVSEWCTRHRDLTADSKVFASFSLLRRRRRASTPFLFFFYRAKHASHGALALSFAHEVFLFYYQGLLVFELHNETYTDHPNPKQRIPVCNPQRSLQRHNAYSVCVLHHASPALSLVAGLGGMRVVFREEGVVLNFFSLCSPVRVYLCKCTWMQFTFVFTLLPRQHVAVDCARASAVRVKYLLLIFNKRTWTLHMHKGV